MNYKILVDTGGYDITYVNFDLVLKETREIPTLAFLLYFLTLLLPTFS
jgi:hypothetical protein